MIEMIVVILVLAVGCGLAVGVIHTWPWPTRTQLYFGLAVLVARLAYRIEALAISIANEGNRPASVMPLPGATGRLITLRDPRTEYSPPQPVGAD